MNFWSAGAGGAAAADTLGSGERREGERSFGPKGDRVPLLALATGRVLPAERRAICEALVRCAAEGTVEELETGRSVLLGLLGGAGQGIGAGRFRPEPALARGAASAFGGKQAAGMPPSIILAMLLRNGDMS